jgi:hypothetical protein
VTEFATGAAETASLALVVDNGSSPRKVCSVTLAPQATTTNLATVLNAAVAGTTPASCVTGFLPASGEGAITQVNGFPTTPAERWKIGIDGGALETAKRSTVIHVGDTIYLARRQLRDRWTGKSGEKPARTRHCDRAQHPVASRSRQPLARAGKARRDSS